MGSPSDIYKAREERINAAVKRAGKTGSTVDPHLGTPLPKAADHRKPAASEAEGRPRGGFYGGMTKNKK